MSTIKKDLNTMVRAKFNAMALVQLYANELAILILVYLSTYLSYSFAFQFDHLSYPDLVELDLDRLYQALVGACFYLLFYLASF